MLDSPLPILTDQEQKIVSYMTRNQTVAFQELADAIRLDTQEVMQILTMLEIKGAVTQEGPGRYMLTMHSQCQRER
ncbi:MAG: FeoC-like transcriptional regulator [bacterium]